jgi:RNA polymerase sigma-70 factor (ECF subfamily)
MPDWDSILKDDGPAVWRSARRLLGNDADADECFQEAFLGALEFSRRSSVIHWRALLTRLATARAIDRLRQRTRQGNREEPADWEQLRQSAPLPPEQAETAELSERLRIALTELPPRQAEIFCLACLDRWSHQEIAARLGISVDSVGVGVYRARQKLQQLLAASNEVRQ